ncbi:squalene synthase HpnC [Pandoraea eparura]|uniref:Squalene synthase HpnC n=1 Tax=Pandoraea eparura TaxID=2508291 RepID=A0A5E4VV73_9BURK|nr:squalene synthase HpnC [Pandoraea eparura]VVE16417.1 squalene synthase HpnC [Pandoraea eparura]
MTSDAKIEHYENFPVASILLPREMRAPVGVIYNFARTADDIADEGDASNTERHASLAAYQAELDNIAAGQPTSPDRPLFAALARVIAEHRLAVQPFSDLLSAFDQDIEVKRYATFADLRDYTRRSADPVGRIMLGLFKLDTPENIACSDDICSALQLINFWQDVEVDWRKARVYLPQDDMARFGVTDADIGAQTFDERWRALMRYEVDFARRMMLRGAPLANRVPGRFGLELCCVVHGGLRILERIEAVNYDVFRHRPQLGKADGLRVFLRGLGMKLGGVPPKARAG